MKKNILLLIIVLGFATNIFSQEIHGIANYKIKLGEDNLFFDAKLEFDSNKSFFVFKQRNISKWKIKKGSIEAGDTKFISQTVYTDTLGYIVFKDLNKPFLLVRDFCKENQAKIYKDTVKFDWKITNKTEEVQGLNCTLATTKFRGRHYKAWFTLTIPLSFGPWKFGGLPGLIVEIQDDKKEVLIQLKSIDLNVKPKMEYDIKGEETTLKKISKCKDKEWEKSIKKTEAFFARMRAESPDLEIETSTPDRRPATELNFDK